MVCPYVEATERNIARKKVIIDRMGSSFHEENEIIGPFTSSVFPASLGLPYCLNSTKRRHELHAQNNIEQLPDRLL